MKRIGLLAVILAFVFSACVHEFSYERTVAIKSPLQTVDEVIPQLNADADGGLSVKFLIFDFVEGRVEDIMGAEGAKERAADNVSNSLEIKKRFFQLDGKKVADEARLISYAKGDINRLGLGQFLRNIVGCGSLISTAEILEGMDDGGLRPATFDELVAFLVAHPAVHNTWIVALGSPREYKGRQYYHSVMRTRMEIYLLPPSPEKEVLNWDELHFNMIPYGLWCTEVHQFLAVPKE